MRNSEHATRDIFEPKNPHLAFSNVCLNLNTKQAEKFKPENYLLSKLPAEYHPEIGYRNSLFWKFLNEIQTPEGIKALQEMLGAILESKYRTKKFFILSGETDTGKSTFINAVIALLGIENTASVPLHRMAENDRFFMAQLFGKMANVVDDLPKNVVKIVGALKQITGRSQIEAEKKNGQPFRFTSHAVVICTCNKPPEFEEDDLALWNRLKIISFEHKIPIGEQDRQLGEKLSQPEELSAILNFALEGLDVLEKQGYKITETQTNEEVRETYKRKSDSVWAWSTDCLNVDPAGHLFKELAFLSYSAYCKARNVQPVSKDRFYKTLPDKLELESEYVTDSDGKRKHAWAGAKMKSEPGADTSLFRAERMDMINAPK